MFRQGKIVGIVCVRTLKLLSYSNALIGRWVGSWKIMSISINFPDSFRASSLEMRSCNVIR